MPRVIWGLETVFTRTVSFMGKCVRVCVWMRGWLMCMCACENEFYSFGIHEHAKRATIERRKINENGLRLKVTTQKPL